MPLLWVLSPLMLTLNRSSTAKQSMTSPRAQAQRATCTRHQRHIVHEHPLQVVLPQRVELSFFAPCDVVCHRGAFLSVTSNNDRLSILQRAGRTRHRNKESGQAFLVLNVAKRRDLQSMCFIHGSSWTPPHSSGLNPRREARSKDDYNLSLKKMVYTGIEYVTTTACDTESFKELLD